MTEHSSSEGGSAGREATPQAQEPEPAPELRPEILAYYNRDSEDQRLRSGHSRLELWRTQDILRRVLPAAPARVLDVGGGTGVHAEWLAADGYAVELLDPVPLHVERAGSIPGVVAVLGDARALPYTDESADAVLLLGPLYHLLERADRVSALAEARRVVRPGGLVVAATINRFAGLHDLLNRGALFDPVLRAGIEAGTEDGAHFAVSAPEAGFTTAYFHDPADVPGEFADAGLAPDGQYSVEGAAWLMGDVEGWLDDPERRTVVLDAMRRTERESSLSGISGHLLTVGRR